MSNLMKKIRNYVILAFLCSSRNWGFRDRIQNLAGFRTRTGSPACLVRSDPSPYHISMFSLFDIGIFVNNSHSKFAHLQFIASAKR